FDDKFHTAINATPFCSIVGGYGPVLTVPYEIQSICGNTFLYQVIITGFGPTCREIEIACTIPGVVGMTRYLKSICGILFQDFHDLIQDHMRLESQRCTTHFKLDSTTCEIQYFLDLFLDDRATVIIGIS